MWEYGKQDMSPTAVTASIKHQNSVLLKHENCLRSKRTRFDMWN